MPYWPKEEGNGYKSEDRESSIEICCGEKGIQANFRQASRSQGQQNVRQGSAEDGQAGGEDVRRCAFESCQARRCET